MITALFRKVRTMYDPLPDMPGKAWRKAEVRTHRARNGELVLRLNGYYFTADMFHVLPEHRDWKSIYRGDIKVVGHIELNWHMLDLVLMDDQGHARSASIDFLSAWFKPFKLRTFLFNVWRQSPVIRLNNTPYRSSK